MSTAVKDLIAWQKAMDLVEQVYRFTAKLPREELYGLTSQMRRSAVSIASNIAEGQGGTPEASSISSWGMRGARSRSCGRRC